jgi:hypothetical protein
MDAETVMRSDGDSRTVDRTAVTEQDQVGDAMGVNLFCKKGFEVRQGTPECPCRLSAPVKPVADVEEDLENLMATRAQLIGQAGKKGGADSLEKKKAAFLH